MEARDGTSKDPDILEDERVTEEPSSIKKPSMREEDARSIASRSSGFSSEEEGFFQLEGSKLEEVATSLGSGTESMKLLQPESEVQVLDEEVGHKESCRANIDSTNLETEKQDDDELSALTQTANPPNEKPCVSDSSSNCPANSNPSSKTSETSTSEGDLELNLFDDNDVHSDMTFKGNHSALDYSCVSQSENHSSYLGFAKQSLVNFANEKQDAYNPSRIPASIFSKPQNPMEWSVASNDSTYKVQEKRVDAQQIPPVLAVPRTNSMPRHSDASGASFRSFAFPVLTPDGKTAAVEVEQSHSDPQADQKKQGWLPCMWFSCLFCC